MAVFHCPNSDPPGATGGGPLSGAVDVESMHHDLKQYFGLQKCKCRREAAVKGHFDLVYRIYSTYRVFHTSVQKKYQVTLPPKGSMNKWWPR